MSRTIRRDKLAEIRRALLQDHARPRSCSDFDRAIDLLKTMETEDERERATVYMQGWPRCARSSARKAAARRRTGDATAGAT